MLVPAAFRRAARSRRRAPFTALLLAAPGVAFAQAQAAPRPPAAVEGAASGADVQTLERVSVTASRPASMPLELPATLESVTAAQIERSVNATDAEDALKYLPSLLVRKRYIGDYDHAVLATRASGTGNSARSLVYADGVLLSNLLGNGAGFTPRWGLVTPEEIERVDVLYGPYSAAYPGNSAGAIVDFVTRMPSRFEAHAKLQGATQRHELYGTDRRFSGGEGSASIGDRAGGLAWWVNLQHLASDGQPIGFVVKPVPAAAGSGGVPVTGAFFDTDPRGRPGYVLGTTGQTHTVQDHAKVKLAYDVSPDVRLSYTLGYWRNDAERGAASFLRDAGGAVVGGTAAPAAVGIDGRRYAVLATDFAASEAALAHVAQGLALKRHGGGAWDWEAVASRYAYVRDRVRAQVPTVAAPNTGADAGRITDQHGTGWTTLGLKAVWRPPASAGGRHVVEFGLQRDAFRLRTTVSDTPDWSGGDAAARYSAFRGDTALTSLWAQDAWYFAPGWKAVLGGRVERWRAADGAIADATATQRFADRAETHVSPKAALAWDAGAGWAVKAAVGRAVRMPTVSELFQGSLVADQIVNNDPNLKPEASWTGELSLERSLDRGGTLRATAFGERTADALYTQVDTRAGGTLATVQNVDRIRTRGVELAAQADDAIVRGLSLSGSVTWADSIVTRNDRFPASIGKRQPRVPVWRATVLASYAAGERWSGSVGARYSGRQYGQLDNSDTHGEAYGGFSRYLVVDVRMQYRLGPQWVASAGIDNLNDDRYWAFHPYPQRTFHAELRWDW